MMMQKDAKKASSMQPGEIQVFARRHKTNGKN
jgi:hypothetical protein